MIGFGEAVRRFFVRYADFQGRSSRAEFWWVALMQFAVLVVMYILVFALGGGGALAGDPGNVSPAAIIPLALMGLYFLGVLIPWIALVVRRLHDIGQTGWIYLGVFIVGLIPVIGLLGTIALIVIGCIPGNRGANQYGDDPYGAINIDTFN